MNGVLRVAAMLVLAGCGGADGAPERDGGGDAGAADAGEPDAGMDAGAGDAGPPDAGAPDAGFSGPWLLSETGLYADVATRTLAPGVVAYDVRYPLWSDGSDKSRFLYLPEGELIDTSDPDRWRFSVGTKAWKEFWRDGVHVETRFLHKRDDGTWLRVAYVWNDDGSDADAVPEGLADARGTEHDVPSSEECFRCHRGAVDDLIGVSAIQLRLPDAPDLLETWIADGRLSEPLPSDPEVPGSGLVQDTLGYMHGNCGHCHNDDHALGAVRSLRLWVPVGLTLPEETPAYVTAIGAPAGHVIEGTDVIVVPGSPETSQLHLRMGLRDPRAMPPLGTELVDTDGMALVAGWIASLPE